MITHTLSLSLLREQQMHSSRPGLPGQADIVAWLQQKVFVVKTQGAGGGQWRRLDDEVTTRASTILVVI